MDLLTNSTYESQYMEILKATKKNGYQELNKRTQVSTLRIPHAVISIDLEKEFPILKCKNVYWKTAAKEILWIMQQQSNNVNDLDASIWDSWADDDGFIGKAYGYQVAKPVTIGGITYKNQVDYVLTKLADDSSDRRAVIDLWNVDDLNDMNLVPCCFTSIWTIINNKLNCMLVQRSADFLVGVPFNTTQYAILTHLFARHLGINVGRLTHVMADCHIYCYDSHLLGATRMIANYEKCNKLAGIPLTYITCIMKGSSNDMVKHDIDVVCSKPILNIKTDKTDFFSISIDDISVDNYVPMENINFDVAV